jgi:hypothetical protein
MKNLIILLGLCFLLDLQAGPELSFTPTPKQVSSEQTNAVAASNLDHNQAQDVMKYLLGLTHIPYDFVEDGCYTQAHEIHLLLQERSIVTGKVFILPKSGLLYPEALREKAYPFFAGWNYHVAPFILVDGAVRVLDPTLGKQALTLEQWAERQSRDLDEVDFVFSDGSFMFHDSKYQPETSGIERLQELVRFRAELGDDEFWWQYEKGWL